MLPYVEPPVLELFGRAYGAWQLSLAAAALVAFPLPATPSAECCWRPSSGSRWRGASASEGGRSSRDSTPPPTPTPTPSLCSSLGSAAPWCTTIAGGPSTSWFAVAFPEGPRLDLGLIEWLIVVPLVPALAVVDRRPRMRDAAPGWTFVLVFANYGLIRLGLDGLRTEPTGRLGLRAGQWGPR